MISQSSSLGKFKKLVTRNSSKPRGVTRGSARGAARGAARDAARGASRGATRGSVQDAVRGAERGAARGAPRGVVRGTARGAALDAVRSATRGAFQATTQGAPNAPPGAPPETPPKKLPKASPEAPLLAQPNEMSLDASPSLGGLPDELLDDRPGVLTYSDPFRRLTHAIYICDCCRRRPFAEITDGAARIQKIPTAHSCRTTS